MFLTFISSGSSHDTTENTEATRFLSASLTSHLQQHKKENAIESAEITRSKCLKFSVYGLVRNCPCTETESTHASHDESNADAYESADITKISVYTV